MAQTWQFDVLTAHHDDMKGGRSETQHRTTLAPYLVVRSRVTISAVDFPNWRTAAEVAACMTMSIHGGMAVNIYPRLGDTP